MISCSVIIPTRDRSAFLVRAVQSAISAIPEDGEVIVIDDASTVPAAESLSHLNFRRLRVLRNEVALGNGGSPSRNRGANAAAGRVLFFLDDDDEVMPGYFAFVLSSGASERADFGFSARTFAKRLQTGEDTYSIERRGLPDGIVSNGQSFARRSFPFSAGFWMTRKAYEVAGPMATTMATNSDTDYCCRLYSKRLVGRYSTQPGIMIHHRQDGDASQLDSVTRRTKAADRAAAFHQISKRHRTFLASNASAAEFVHQRWMKHAIRADDATGTLCAIATAPQLAVRLKLRLKYVGLRLVNLLDRSRRD